jgi:hypothetical protein
MPGSSCKPDSTSNVTKSVKKSVFVFSNAMQILTVTVAMLWIQELCCCTFFDMRVVEYFLINLINLYDASKKYIFFFIHMWAK